MPWRIGGAGSFSSGCDTSRRIGRPERPKRWGTSSRESSGAVDIIWKSVQDAGRSMPRHIGIVRLVVTNRGVGRVFGTSDRAQDSMPEGRDLISRRAFLSVNAADRAVPMPAT